MRKTQATDLHRQYLPSLGDQVNNIEQEARMVLPGVQALIGFQLIAVFNASFTHLSEREQRVHLLALLLVAASAAFLLAPAAYHRLANHQISEHFVKMASRLLAWALPPLAAGVCLDIFLVSRLILGSEMAAAVTTLPIALLYLCLWFVYPILRAHRVRQLPTHPLAEAERARLSDK